MEKIPTDYFAIIKWWISLKITDKLLAYLLAGIIAISTVCFRLSSSKEELQRSKDVLQTENLNARVECEQRVASAVTSERRRSDSVNYAQEIKKQDLFSQRTPQIKERITKIEKALK